VLRIADTLAGDSIEFCMIETAHDLYEFREFVRGHRSLGIDTESTGLNCYRPKWKLRTVQCGNATVSYVVPARFRKAIAWLMRQPVNWIAHNGPHDIRCIDAHLGYETGVVCAGETYLPAHHRDSRGREEGGTGHELKELAIAFIDRNAGRWEIELKKAFKEITIPIPGAVYKSGARKGQPKTRKAKLSEGWALINPTHPAYIAYAAADPILTYRLYRKLQPTVREFHDLYDFDHRVQLACDRLQRRAIRLDVAYTQRLSEAFTAHAEAMKLVAFEYGCANIHSGKQVADTLLDLGARLTERTKTGLYKTDDPVMRKLMNETDDAEVRNFIRAVLIAKQLLKRRESYTEAMLREMDARGRVHPSINSLGARTARMSVSNPPLQQLPTKDREDELTNA
jgi:DNA polymerase I